MKSWQWLIIGILVGGSALVVVRWFTYQDDSVHYHANFAVFVNGVRDEFKAPGFYQEVLSCDTDHLQNPLERTHMHEQVNDVAHVHDHGVTWGQFFENLGYSISSLALKTADSVYVDDQSAKLSFILNGQPVDDVSSRVIQSQDRLLVNFGQEPPAELLVRYGTISTSAADYNHRDDTSACAGQVEPGWKTRLRQAIF